MGSEADIALIKRYRSELSDARDALLNAYRQLAALRTERKMQEARKSEIAYLHRVIRLALSDLAKVTAERDEALADGVLSSTVCDLENAVADLRAEIARVTAERDAYRSALDKAEDEGDASAIELNQLRQEATTLRGERSRLVTERDALLRAAQAKPLRTVEETMAGQAGVLAALAPHDRAAPPTAELDEARAQAEAAAIELNQLRQEVTTLRGKSASLASPKNGANDPCAACGCDRVFHQIGTGNGVPVGQPYCDDRYAAPCDCRGFVKRVVTAPPTTVQLGGHRMDADGGPVCRCGKPSTHESGWCGACGVTAAPAPDPFAAIKSDVESLWAVLSRHADAIAELRRKAGGHG